MMEVEHIYNILILACVVCHIFSQGNGLCAQTQRLPKKSMPAKLVVPMLGLEFKAKARIMKLVLKAQSDNTFSMQRVSTSIRS